MGSSTFIIRSKGKTPEEAHNAAVLEAQHEHGHGGYTGTIAEKAGCGIVMFRTPEGVRPGDYARKVLDDVHSDVNEDDGPTGCIDLGDGSYLFFGWASS